jgi:uncharacterized protein YkwD
LTGPGLRLASAAAAVIVSAVVAAAALYGGSAISSQGGSDERLVAVPATTSPSPTATPRTGASSTSPASAHQTPECQGDKTRARCPQPTRPSTATPTTQSSESPRTRTKAATRQPAIRTTETYKAKPTPTRSSSRPTEPVRSTPSRSVASSTGYTTRSDWANAVLAELNAERARHGLPALKLNSKLVAAAHTHNLAMAKADTLSHQLSGEARLGSRVSAAGYRWSLVGENVAYNSNRSQDGVLAVQKAMYNEEPPDDGHRRNILNERFVDVGIDVINDSVHDKVWLVTDFGRP